MVCLGAGFAPDRRQPLPQHPAYSSLVRTNVQGGLGCGVLIGPDLVLTCAHNISDERGELRQNGWVEVGSQRVSVDTVYITPHWDHRPDSGQDWAILKLCLPLGWREGWLECQELSDAEMRGLEVEFMGYSSNPDEARPEFSDMKLPYLCPGQVLDVGQHIVFHNCAIWGGSSGAPLVRWTPAGDCRVVAMNTAGVGVEGEALDHGFRQHYTRELGNVAVPAMNWMPVLRQIPRPERPLFRRLEVENDSEQPIQLRLRYHTLFADPPQLESEWRRLAPGQTTTVLDVRDGCAESNLEYCLEGQSDWQRLSLDGETTQLSLP